eukprot:3367283-Amphidinium_carterae.1
MALVYAAAFYASLGPDTEWNKFTTAPTAEQLQHVKENATAVFKCMQAATTLLLSTKVCWWSTNHHVGQGQHGHFNSTVTAKAWKAANEGQNCPVSFFISSSTRLVTAFRRV